MTDTATHPYRARSPQPEDFRVEWNDTHVFEFFEDENANALWAHGTLSDEDFVAQANEYDRITDDDWNPDDAYTVHIVETFWGILRYQSEDHPDDWRIFPCDEHTSGATLCKRIDR